MTALSVITGPFSPGMDQIVQLVNQLNAILGATTTNAGALTVTGNFAVGSNVFQVASASGNTVVGGTLAVSGASTLTGATHIVGAATLDSTIAVTGAATLSTTSASKTSSSTTADNIVILGAATNSATGITAGNINGTKGQVTLSGTVTGGAFISGAYGKLIITGTQNHADSRLMAGFFKVDASAGTITAGQLSAIWADMGATSPAGGWADQTNVIRLQNTTAAAVNSLLYGYGKASYLADLSDNSGDWADLTGSGGTTTGKGWLKVLVNGAVRYIALADSVS